MFRRDEVHPDEDQSVVASGGRSLMGRIVTAQANLGSDNLQHAGSQPVYLKESANDVHSRSSEAFLGESGLKVWTTQHGQSYAISPPAQISAIDLDESSLDGTNLNMGRRQVSIQHSQSAAFLSPSSAKLQAAVGSRGEVDRRSVQRAARLKAKRGAASAKKSRIPRHNKPSSREFLARKKEAQQLQQSRTEILVDVSAAPNLIRTQSASRSRAHAGKGQARPSTANARSAGKGQLGPSATMERVAVHGRARVSKGQARPSTANSRAITNDETHDTKGTRPSTAKERSIAPNHLLVPVLTTAGSKSTASTGSPPPLSTLGGTTKQRKKGLIRRRKLFQTATVAVVNGEEGSPSGLADDGDKRDEHGDNEYGGGTL
jgi:hypothetical protein